MKRSVLVLALVAAVAVVTTMTACGGNDTGGVAVLGGSPSTSPSSSPTSPSPSPTATATVSSTPSVTGSPTDGPFDGETMTADDLDAYLGEVRPIYRELMRIERISGEMLIEVPTVADPSWDVAADRTEGYADEIEMQLRLFREIEFPPSLLAAHDAMIESLDKEVEMYELLATQLRDRTWNPVRGTKDVNRLSREFNRLREQYQAELEAASADLGVPIPWNW